jgi:type I restriction enzyme R subunit
MTEQMFEDYKSKYLDLYEKSRSEKEGAEKASIIEEVDFELELIQRDEINVAYILALLAKLKEALESDDEKERQSAGARKQAILDLLGSEVQLRSKRDLVERFIAEYLPNVSSPDLVETGFNDFWTEEREKSVAQFCNDEGLKREDVDAMIATYHFTQKVPLREAIVSALKIKLKILERKPIVQRIADRLMGLITTFDDA